MLTGTFVECPVCGKKAYRYPCKVKKYNKFCSKKCWYSTIRGKGNPHFGMKHTEDVKLFISEKNKGRKRGEAEQIQRKVGGLTGELRQKAIEYFSRKIRRGKDCHFWKGGATSKSRKERLGLKHRAWSKAVLKRDNYTCLDCGTRGGELNAHHIREFAKHPELRYDISNGKTLCFGCHAKIHKSLRNFIKS